MAIHPTAAIAPGAKIGRNVEIGPMQWWKIIALSAITAG
ncbi:MAG: hypothetical protein IKD10_10170 [Lentisphaeria bacterium]|nr:hypothetical protein [Lentisphaeria bacterium]